MLERLIIMCKCHGNDYKLPDGCRQSVFESQKHKTSRPHWRKYFSKDERIKKLEKYKKELKKEIEAINEKLEEL